MVSWYYDIMISWCCQQKVWMGGEKSGYLPFSLTARYKIKPHRPFDSGALSRLFSLQWRICGT